MAARASDDFLTQRIDDFRDEMRANFEDVRTEMRGGFLDVRTELRALRARMDILMVATIGGLLGVIATLAVKL